MNRNENENENLITEFYSAFQRKDYLTMQQCYTDAATFSDPVFKNLNAAQVKGMWEMFCKGGSDVNIEFNNVKADDKKGTANWIATYTFSRTGKKVVNRISAKFEFENGKIKRHSDAFNFYTWSSQAFGVTGMLIGWTVFFKRKVQQSAAKSLADFLRKK